MGVGGAPRRSIFVSYIEVITHCEKVELLDNPEAYFKVYENNHHGSRRGGSYGDTGTFTR